MGVAQRSNQGRRRRASSKRARQLAEDESRKAYSETRRQFYRNNAEYRERVKETARRAYRKANPKRDNPLAGRVKLSDPKLTMFNPEGGEPFSEYSYTINRAAEALGKNSLTFKRWIQEGLVPPPVFRDSSRNYQHYMYWEIDAMVPVIADHYEVYDYFHRKHRDTAQLVWRAVQAARQERGVQYDNETQETRYAGGSASRERATGTGGAVRRRRRARSG